jgi:septum formation protein
MNLVLASASPRRRELLTQAGFTFTVHPADIPEDPLPNEDPIAYVVRLARQKAEAVLAALTKVSASEKRANAPPQVANSLEPQSAQAQSAPPQVANALEPQSAQAQSAPPQVAQVVVGADTTVVIDNQILAKPTDAADAARMLRLLSGRTHRVITGVAVVTAQRTEVAAEVTGVRFLTLSEEEIATYIATGEPMDKAGAYGIQGYAARWIPRITGDYFNVVGLPIALVATMLEAVAID